MNPCGQGRIPWPGMKPGLVPDDHVFGADVAVGQLLEKPALSSRLTDGRN